MEISEVWWHHPPEFYPHEFLPNGNEEHNPREPQLPAPPLCSSQQDPAAPKPHLPHGGRKPFPVELGSLWIPRDAPPGLALIPARHREMGHNAGANRGSCERTTARVPEGTSQRKTSACSTLSTQPPLWLTNECSCWQQWALKHLKHCSGLPFIPHSHSELTPVKSKWIWTQTLSDAPMNKLHSHKVIKQLTAVKAFLCHTAMSYFFLPPTVSTHLSSTLTLLMDIK